MKTKTNPQTSATRLCEVVLFDLGLFLIRFGLILKTRNGINWLILVLFKPTQNELH